MDYSDYSLSSNTILIIIIVVLVIIGIIILIFAFWNNNNNNNNSGSGTGSSNTNLNKNKDSNSGGSNPPETKYIEPEKPKIDKPYHHNTPGCNCPTNHHPTNNNANHHQQPINKPKVNGTTTKKMLDEAIAHQKHAMNKLHDVLASESTVESADITSNDRHQGMHHRIESVDTSEESSSSDDESSDVKHKHHKKDGKWTVEEMSLSTLMKQKNFSEQEEILDSDEKEKMGHHGKMQKIRESDTKSDISGIRMGSFSTQEFSNPTESYEPSMGVSDFSNIGSDSGMVNSITNPKHQKPKVTDTEQVILSSDFSSPDIEKIHRKIPTEKPKNKKGSIPLPEKKNNGKKS